MERSPDDRHAVTIKDVPPGTLYFYVLDDVTERPDPVSRYQPRGVHGPTQVIETDFSWGDTGWRGLSMKDYIFYEIHVGTFSPEGTFEGVVKKIPYLKKLGVTSIEIMPVGQFPGKRNWGYDGVGFYAVQGAYGGPQGLKKLINACHRDGLAVCLDVVYNHWGPEGNYMEDFGPYFTDRYRTPWGKAVNFDDAGREGVRRFVVENALYWVTEYHVDALRLDAVHGIFDNSPCHILQEIKAKVEEESRRLGRKVMVIAESDLNTPGIVRPVIEKGYGLDAQWSDDFHHALHRVLTGEQVGYYKDYSGLADVAKVMRDGFVYEGQYSVFRGRRFGEPARDIAGEKFVVFVQNHDQVGNRAGGERLSALVSWESERLAAAILLLSPYVPLLFMGQEYGEKDPFLYFIDHSDAGLVKSVREGRRRGFESFGWEKFPDPKSARTFQRSRLDWKRPKVKRHRQLLSLYQDLIALRREVIDLGELKRGDIMVDFDEEARWMVLTYRLRERRRFVVFFSFAEKPLRLPGLFPSGRRFRLWLSTDDEKYGGRQRISHTVVGEAEAFLREGEDILLGPKSALAGELL